MPPPDLPPERPPELPPERPSVFPAPWAARAFALAVALNEGGAFGWADFSGALAAARGADPEGDYFAAWLAALEAVLARRGVPPEAVAAMAEAWQAAARATPHGAPISLGRAPA